MNAWTLSSRSLLVCKRDVFLSIIITMKTTTRRNARNCQVRGQKREGGRERKEDRGRKNDGNWSGGIVF